LTPQPQGIALVRAASAQRAARTARKSRSSKSVASKSTTSKKSKRKQRPPRAVRLSQAERRSRPPAPLRRGVSVTVHFGTPNVHPRLTSKLKRLQTHVSRLPIPRRFHRSAIVVTVLALLFVIVLSVHGTNHKAVPTSGKVAAAERTKPDFKPLMPSADQASAVTYDGKRNMVSYSAIFSGARLTISQQPLPARIAQDPKALSTVADSLHAKQQLSTAAGLLYIATNETNDQMAVFGGKDVLLFIHSDRKLDDASWKAFIELLKTK